MELAPLLFGIPEDYKIFLTSHLEDEARHTVFFDKFYREVVGLPGNSLMEVLDGSYQWVGETFLMAAYDVGKTVMYRGVCPWTPARCWSSSRPPTSERNRRPASNGCRPASPAEPDMSADDTTSWMCGARGCNDGRSCVPSTMRTPS